MVSPEGREGRCFAFNSLLTALNETGSNRSYSNWYPKNSRRRITFSYRTNTVSRCRDPVLLILASFLKTLLIL